MIPWLVFNNFTFILSIASAILFGLHPLNVFIIGLETESFRFRFFREDIEAEMDLWDVVFLCLRAGLAEGFIITQFYDNTQKVILVIFKFLILWSKKIKIFQNHSSAEVYLWVGNCSVAVYAFRKQTIQYFLRWLHRKLLISFWLSECCLFEHLD